MKYNILVVDDEESMLHFYKTVLLHEGYQVYTAEDGEKAVMLLEQKQFHLVITDIRMPHMGGTKLLSYIRKTYPDIAVILITAFGTIKDAVAALKLGACDYLTKPLANPDQLRDVVKKTLNNIMLNKPISLNYTSNTPLKIIAKDPAMQKVIQLITVVAKTDSTVLLTGASGTGKELAAHEIHNQSAYANGPFVAINCAALPENLLESELFGYEKGAFSGAVNKKPGRFELAEGGTIFLDEIGEISSIIQAKILRVLQERTFERLGGVKTIEIQVRVIAATNRDLKSEITKGNFREDLFYRLNVFPIHIPSLRERPLDILPLAKHFLDLFAKKYDKKISSFTQDAIKILKSYSWQGNVRELQNTIERAVIICNEGLISNDYFLDLNICNDYSIALPGDARLEKAEKDTIEKVLLECNGNRTVAAKVLGISIRSLHYKIKQYGLK